MNTTDTTHDTEEHEGLDALPPFLTTKELARRWGWHPQSLVNLRTEGRGIDWVRLGPGSIRYRREDILAHEREGLRK